MKSGHRGNAPTIAFVTGLRFATFRNQFGQQFAGYLGISSRNGKDGKSSLPAVPFSAGDDRSG
jgi:hypothetical protein